MPTRIALGVLTVAAVLITLIIRTVTMAGM